jgi:putative transposase
MKPLHFLLICLAGWMNRQQQAVIEYLEEEICVLKEQLGKPLHFDDRQRRRLAAKGQAVGRRGLERLTNLVTPDTLLAWHRRLIGQKYASKPKNGPGRPPSAIELRELICRLAGENRTWGYTRIQGALQNPGHEVGRGTIAKVLKEEGIEPAPERHNKTTWKEFLRNHWDVLAGTDFFTVEVASALGLVRYHVLFVIRLATPEVPIAGIIPEPDGGWIKQMARNLTDFESGFLKDCRYLIHDRASLFGPDFTMILKARGIESVRLPARSPNLNAFAERFVKSIKEDCLNRLVLIGVSSLRCAVTHYVEHYHSERNHQGLDNKLIHPEFNPLPTEGAIKRRKRLGGLLNYYYREAA